MERQGLEDACLLRQERTAEACDERTDGEHEQLVPTGLDTDGRSGRLGVPHGEQHPPQAAAAHLVSQHQHDRQPHQLEVVEGVRAVERPAEDTGAADAEPVGAPGEHGALEHEAVRQQPDGQRCQPEKEPAAAQRRPSRRQSHEHGADTADDHGRDDGHAPGVGDACGDEAAEAGERALAEGDVAAEAGDDDDRHEHDHQRHHALSVGVGRERECEREGHQSDADAAVHAGGEARVLGQPEARSARRRRRVVLPDYIEPPVDEEGGEQDDDRQVGLELFQTGAEEALSAGDVGAGEQALGHAEEQDPGGHRDRQAGEPGHDGDRERLDDQECEPDRVEAVGGQQHPGEAGEHAPERPRQAGHPVGAHRRQLGQRPAVDDGPDLGPELRPPEQHPHGGADDDDEDDDDELVGSDAQTGAEQERPVAEQARSLPHFARPDGVGGAEQQREHAESGDELLRRPCPLAVERAEDEPLEDVAESATHADERHGHRDPQRQRPPGPQLPERVGHDHGDGAVGEVEHACHLVREHDSHPRQGVDGPRGDAGEDELDVEHVSSGRQDGSQSRHGVKPCLRADDGASVVTPDFPRSTPQSGAWNVVPRPTT